MAKIIISVSVVFIIGIYYTENEFILRLRRFLKRAYVYHYTGRFISRRKGGEICTLVA
jgi:hypothetical protein